MFIFIPVYSFLVALGLWDTKKHFTHICKRLPTTSVSSAPGRIFCLHHFWWIRRMMLFHLLVGLQLNRPPRLYLENVVFIPTSAHLILTTKLLFNVMICTLLRLAQCFLSQQLQPHLWRSHRGLMVWPLIDTDQTTRGLVEVWQSDLCWIQLFVAAKSK